MGRRAGPHAHPRACWPQGDTGSHPPSASPAPRQQATARYKGEAQDAERARHPACPPHPSPLPPAGGEGKRTTSSEALIPAGSTPKSNSAASLVSSGSGALGSPDYRRAAFAASASCAGRGLLIRPPALFRRHRLRQAAAARRRPASAGGRAPARAAPAPPAASPASRRVSPPIIATAIGPQKTESVSGTKAKTAASAVRITGRARRTVLSTMASRSVDAGLGVLPHLVHQDQRVAHDHPRQRDDAEQRDEAEGHVRSAAAPPPRRGCRAARWRPPARCGRSGAAAPSASAASPRPSPGTARRALALALPLPPPRRRSRCRYARRGSVARSASMRGSAAAVTSGACSPGATRRARSGRARGCGARGSAPPSPAPAARAAPAAPRPPAVAMVRSPSARQRARAPSAGARSTTSTRRSPSRSCVAVAPESRRLDATARPPAATGRAARCAPRPARGAAPARARPRRAGRRACRAWRAARPSPASATRAQLGGIAAHARGTARGSRPAGRNRGGRRARAPPAPRRLRPARSASPAGARAPGRRGDWITSLAKASFGRSGFSARKKRGAPAPI